MELSQWLDRETVFAVKLGLAAFGLVLLLVDAVTPRGRRWRDALLAAAALLAVPCWFELGRFTVDRPLPSLRWVNFPDSFHYYMGAKYFEQLGYAGLYECAAVAEAELGSAPAVARRTYRDLATNGYVVGRDLLRESRRCHERLGHERWTTFVRDVDFFRRRVPTWPISMQDWGYNATPVWNLLGSLVIGSEPVSERELAVLTLLDVPCLVAMWAFIAWAFGWRTLCVVLIVWGSNLWSEYVWTGGSILRQAWLVTSVIGVCLLRRGRSLLAGAALGTSALLTIFPGFLAAALGLKALLGWWEERRVRLSAEQLNLLLGASLALVVLLPAAALEARGPRAWLEFAHNSRIDSQPSPNNMGLPALLSFDGDQLLRLVQLSHPGKVVARWTEARHETSAARRPLWLVVVAAYLVLLAGALRRQPDWAAAILGLGLVTFCFELSNYYFVFLVLFALFWPEHRSIGIALVATSLLSGLARERWLDDEEFFAATSLLAVAFTAFATLVLRFRARPAADRDRAVS